jgi:hypothetical protein
MKRTGTHRQVLTSRINRGPHRRFGTTLMEVVIMISIASVLLGLCVTMMASLLRAQRRVNESTRETMVLSRIRRQLQKDVHAATSVTTDPDGQLILQFPGEPPVVLSASEHVLNRKQTLSADRVSREAFRLRIGSTTSLELLDDGKRLRFVVLRPTTTPPAVAEGANPINVKQHRIELESMIGHDYRFSTNN